MRPGYAAALDAALVVLFAALGRTSHAEGLALAGVAATAAPFLAGALTGWALGLVTGLRPLSPGFGVLVVAAAVVVGMNLRHLFGAGVAFSFILVATGVLGVLLVGWRLVAARLGRVAES